ncbi:MAG: rod shape-determining protein MreB [Blastocatellia bacterium]|jgi:rod shape-determining protein MreB|nr:rod shape-determining protein MreB [Blastocatellia bacterium]
MGILSGFFSEDLAIDLGTVNTIVYAPTQGVVLNEPSVLAIHKYSREVLSVGSQALKLLGREPNDTEVHRPIRRGAIDNFEISQMFLRALISRVQHNDHPKRSHLVIGVPGSSTPLERRSVKDAARDAKAGRVDLIDEGLAAGLGAGLNFEEEQAHLVVDIGGGTSNVAILASGGVVTSVSVPAAGNAMDEAIRDYLRLRYAVQIGERTAEQVKKELGLAWDYKYGEQSQKEMQIVGKQLANGAALPITINAREVSGALEPILAEIISTVRRVIEDAKPEVTADLFYSGVTLTGGGALLGGMTERFENDLNLSVSLPEDPLTTVALGAGRLLGDPEKLQRATLRLDVPAWEEAEKLVVNW